MKSKKYTVAILALFMLCITTSCSDFLEEESRGLIFPETFFTNPAELELAVTSIYNGVGIQNGHDRIVAPWQGADDMTSTLDMHRQYDVFRGNGSNTDVERWWRESWAVIIRCNNVILNYHRAEATEEQKNHAAGQAYFARAWTYYNLVRTYNRIPLVLDLTVDFEIKKSEPGPIYSLIVEDLKKAEQLLPIKWTNYKALSGYTSGAAKALLANVYLSMAGYPLKDESKYALAAEKAKEIIDNEALYGYRLLDDYADLWKASNQKHDEIVFGIYYNVSAGDGNQRTPVSSMPTEYGGWDVYFAEINFFNEFPEGPRKDATFQTTFPMENGDLLDWTENRQRHPYYKKMWDIPGYNPEKPWIYINYQESRTNQVIRYAEVLLTYAEAKAMSSSPDITAYNAVNRVRARAGLDDLPEGLSREEFRDAVVAERGWEFAAEFGIRWFDLVRLERVEAAAANRHEWENPLVSPPTKNEYFSPIPDNEILRNPNLAN